MKVLVLSPYPEPILQVLAASGDEGTAFADRLDAKTFQRMSADFVVSYGYRHILQPDILAVLPDRIINLHISLLPWNRGSDPNFWSFLEGTPKGVTIHFVDEGIDTGDVIAQKPVFFGPEETLSGSYAKLQESLCALFAETWTAIRNGKNPRRPQSGAGSLHRARDKEPHLHLLEKGWDTPVSVLEDYGRRHGLFKGGTSCDNAQETRKGA